MAPPLLTVSIKHDDDDLLYYSFMWDRSKAAASRAIRTKLTREIGYEGHKGHASLCGIVDQQFQVRR